MSTTLSNLNVLVSGGGIAGNAVALQLLRAGAAVTVIERAATQRPGGQAVDLRGPSKEVAEKMGLMPGIRARQLHELGMSMIDEKGQEYGRMPMEMFDGAGAIAEIEISRGDLNQVLLDLLAPVSARLDYRYGEWLTAIDSDADGVTVTLASGVTERYDLVVGADGVHSATRRLAFGPEDEFVTYLGGYASFFTMPTPAGTEQGWFKMHTMPSASVGIRTDYDPATSKAIINIRTDRNPALRGDIAAQQQLIRDGLAEGGWETPTVLGVMPNATDFYFDELDRVDVPQLWNGRVVLVGDAGYCGSPLTGQGTAMALVGAYVLVGELLANPGDLNAALACHDEVLRPFIKLAQVLPGGGLKMMLPGSWFGVRNGRRLWKLMLTKPFRPIMMKMFTKTDDYDLPQYQSAVAA